MFILLMLSSLLATDFKPYIIYKEGGTIVSCDIIKKELILDSDPMISGAPKTTITSYVLDYNKCQAFYKLQISDCKYIKHIISENELNCEIINLIYYKDKWIKNNDDQ